MSPISLSLGMFYTSIFMHIKCDDFINVLENASGKIILYSTTVRSLSDCANSCSLEAKCSVFSYNKERHTCKLHQMFDFYSATMVEDSIDWAVYGRNISTSPVCELGWFPYGESCYFFGDEIAERNWSDAKQYCENKGGYLVEMDSEQKQMFLYLNGKSEYWLGGKYESGQGKWMWNHSGRTVPLSTQTEAGFSSWIPGHPVNPRKHCMSTQKNFNWGARFCWVEKKLFCEKPI